MKKKTLKRILFAALVLAAAAGIYSLFLYSTVNLWAYITAGAACLMLGFIGGLWIFSIAMAVETRNLRRREEYFKKLSSENLVLKGKLAIIEKAYADAKAGIEKLTAQTTGQK